MVFYAQKLVGFHTQGFVGFAKFFSPRHGLRPFALQVPPVVMLHVPLTVAVLVLCNEFLLLPITEIKTLLEPFAQTAFAIGPSCSLLNSW